MPEALIVGGPNGAGKSTFALEYLQERDLRYLSADRIAVELNPEAPEEAKIQAGKVFFRRLNQAIEDGEDLVVESTLAGRGMGRIIERIGEKGYMLRIAFLFLDTPEMCVRRVKQRVRRGGHDVPRPDIIRRFYRSIWNFWTVYRKRGDQWYLFSNTEDRFQQVAFGEEAEQVVLEETLFDAFQELVSSADEYT